MHRNDPQTSPILWWPPQNILKIFIPQTIFIFLKTQTNIEIQNFEPQKIAWAYVCVKISEYPPGIRCSHAESMDIDEDSDPYLELKPAGSVSTGVCCKKKFRICDKHQYTMYWYSFALK